MINWRNVAEPQADASDTVAILELTGFVKAPELGRNLFGARLEQTLDFTPKIPDLVIDFPDDAFLEEVEVLVSLWPELHAQMLALLQAVYPVVHVTGKKSGFGGSYGTRDQDVVNHFGYIYASTDTIHGFTEGLASSLGNWKLYGTGIKTITWDNRLITNDPEQLVQTPMRQEMRPVGITLHAAYAIMHVLELNLRIAQVDDRDWATHAKFSIARQIERINRALVTFDHITTTEEGAAFMAGIKAWGTRLVAEGAKWV